jgi:hypothetical protein
MAITVVQAPQRVQFSRNPITFILNTTEAAQPNIRVFIEVQYWNPATSSFYAVATLSTRPNAVGQCTFELENVLDSAAAPWLPAASDGITNKLVDRYRIRWWESYGAPPMAQPSNVSATYTVLRGGLPITSTNAQREAYHKGWPRRILTTMPLSRRTHPDTPQFMYFVTSPRAEVQGVQLRVIVNTTTASNLQYTRYNFTFTGNVELLRIKTDWASLAIPISIFDVVSYTVYLIRTNGANQRVSEAITYIVDNHCCPIRHFVYENSLGGFDSLYSTAWSDESIEVERDFAEMYRPFNYQIKGVERYNLGSNQNYNARNILTIKTGTGYKPVDEIDAHRDMLISRAVYEYINGDFYPIVITSNSANIKNSRESLYGFEFEYQYAFTYDTLQTDLNAHQMC